MVGSPPRMWKTNKEEKPWCLCALGKMFGKIVFLSGNSNLANRGNVYIIQTDARLTEIVEDYAA